MVQPLYSFLYAALRRLNAVLRPIRAQVARQCAVGSEPTAPLAPRGPRARGGSAPAPLGTALAGSLIWFTFNLILLIN